MTGVATSWEAIRSCLFGSREFVNYRHPDPRRGEPRVCSTQLDAFPEDPVDPLDPLQNSGRLILKHPSRSFGIFGREMGTHFSIFHLNPGNPLFLIFRTDFLAKNNPRRERCHLAQEVASSTKGQIHNNYQMFFILSSRIPHATFQANGSK